MMVSSTPIIPVYLAISVAGIVLDRDEAGQVHHTVVVDTTLSGHVVVVYRVV